MVDDLHRGKLVDNTLRTVAYWHLQADLENVQYCFAHQDIRSCIEAATLNIWCCDPRGAMPRYCVLGGSWAVLLRLISTFLALLPSERRALAFAAIRREFCALCAYYRQFVRPCMHSADDGLGCGYLGELTGCPEKYDCYPDIALLVGMIDGCRLDSDGFEIVRGNRNHALGAMIVRSDGILPMVTPKQAAGMFFIWHPQVEQWLLRWVAPRILPQLQEVSGCGGIDSRQFSQCVWDLSVQHVALALKKFLAPGKPVLEVYIRSGRIEIL